MRVVHCSSDASTQPGPASLSAVAFGSLFNAVGTARFAEALLGAIGGAFGIRYMAAYVMDAGRPDTRFIFGAAPGAPALLQHSTRRYVARFSARDPAKAEALQAPPPTDTGVVATCVAVADLPDSEHRTLLAGVDIGERIAAYFPAEPERWIGLHMMRERQRGAMTDAEFDRFSTLAPVVAAVVTRHVNAATPADAPAARLALRLHAQCPGLSGRERDVCARLLAGETSAEMANRLGLGVASVHTYRERAYAKLGVRSVRELLLLLLDEGDDRGVTAPMRHASRPVA